MGGGEGSLRLGWAKYPKADQTPAGPSGPILCGLQCGPKASWKHISSAVGTQRGWARGQVFWFSLQQD
jgi:hypothetical protein